MSREGHGVVSEASRIQIRGFAFSKNTCISLQRGDRDVPPSKANLHLSENIQISNLEAVLENR